MWVGNKLTRDVESGPPPLTINLAGHSRHYVVLNLPSTTITNLGLLNRLFLQALRALLRDPLVVLVVQDQGGQMGRDTRLG